MLPCVGNENILGQCEYANRVSGAELIPHREIKYVKNNFWLYILPFVFAFLKIIANRFTRRIVCIVTR